MTSNGHTSGSEVAIGVVGPRDLVERIILTGRTIEPGSAPAWRLVGAAYRDEHEAPLKVARIQDRVDVVLFTGPLPYDIARATGALDRPATYVPLNGASLFSTMIRAMHAQSLDLGAVSIDSLARAEVREAYDEIGVSSRKVRVREYDGPRSAEAFAEWHTELFREGHTRAAFTTVRSVAQQLQHAKVPTFRVLPAPSSLRVGLSTASLIGSHSRLEDAQIVVAMVGLPPSRSSATDDYWRHEMRLSVHQVLLREARAMGASVLQRDERSYFVAATLGSLEQATDDLRKAPFLAAIEDALGVPVAVGIGLAPTAREAEKNAVRALDQAWAEGDVRCCVLRSGSSILALPAHTAAAEHPVQPQISKGMSMARQLIDGLAGDVAKDEPPVVDADTAARILGVSVRTTRRLLASLVEQGLAWPMPPTPPAGRGRPRQLYRLVVDRWPETATQGGG